MIPGKLYTPELVLQMAWRRKWWIILPAITIVAATIAWTRTLTDSYRSDALILVVPQQVPENYVKSTVTATVADRLQTISQQILSRTRLEKIILDLNLFEAQRKTGIMEDIVDGMRSSIDVQLVKGDAFRISFTDRDPRTAMRVTERLGSLFIDESLRDREVLAEGTSQFLEAQLEDARRQLIDNEQKLEAYQRSHDGQLPAQLSANMQGLHNTEMQMQALSDSLDRDRERHDALKRLIADLEASEYTQPQIPNAPAGPQTQTAAARLSAAQASLAELQHRLKPDHPDVVRAKKAMIELEKAAEAEAAAVPVSPEDAPPSAAERLRRTRLNDANHELEVLDRSIEKKTNEQRQLQDNLIAYQKRIEATPSRESELTELTRDYGTLQGMYRTLLGKKQESQISANLERRQIGEQFRILDPARLPTKPFSPNRPRFYGLGVAGGLMVGLGLAFLLEYLDRTLRSEDDVRIALGLPVLATVPLIAHHRPRRVVVALSAVTVTGIVAIGIFAAFRFFR